MDHVLNILITLHHRHVEIMFDMFETFQLPSLAKAKEFQLMRAKVTHRHPYTAVVIAHLKTKSYAEKSKNESTELWLSNRLKLPIDGIWNVLSKLTKLGILKELKNRSYEINSSNSSLGSQKESNDVISYWLKRSSEIIVNRPPKNKSAFVYTTFILGEQSHKKVIQRIIQCYDDLYRIVEDETSDDQKVYVFNLALLDLN